MVNKKPVKPQIPDSAQIPDTPENNSTLLANPF